MPFDGIALADTFQVYEEDDQLDLEVFTTNNERIEKQKNTPIHIIVGNPPYSVGQTSANDLNANMKYPSLDHRIETSYADKSTATNKNWLYDSYLRAFRWATDRVTEGVVAFVTNGGWPDGNTADGVRLTFAEDYSDIYVFNLRGNTRTSGEQARKEGGQTFGPGSRATIAIFVGGRTPGATRCRIHYRDIGDYLSAKEKLEIVDKSTIDNTSWETITPNQYGDWINQRSDKFSTWPVLGDKKTPDALRFFNNYSRGLSTARDAWCYNSTAHSVIGNIRRMLSSYSEALAEYQQSPFAAGRNEASANEFPKAHPEHNDSREIAWDANLKMSLGRQQALEFDPAAIRESLYRPFSVRRLISIRHLINADTSSPACSRPRNTTTLGSS